MTGLRPAFKKDGTVTAANASGINDGGAAIILMSAKDAEARNAPVLGRIASWATCGVEPEFMGIGPAPARRSEEHTSELQSLMRISYAVSCLKKTHRNSTRLHSHI